MNTVAGKKNSERGWTARQVSMFSDINSLQWAAVDVANGSLSAFQSISEAQQVGPRAKAVRAFS